MIDVSCSILQWDDCDQGKVGDLKLKWKNIRKSEKSQFNKFGLSEISISKYWSKDYLNYILES